MKVAIIALWAIFMFAEDSQASDTTFFRTVAPIQALCVMGGPDPIIEELLAKYNEKPVHGVSITPTIHMYITENCNNPSSTFFLHNSKANQTCIFWSAENCLETIETESLPAKKPEGMKLES